RFCPKPTNWWRLWPLHVSRLPAAAKIGNRKLEIGNMNDLKFAFRQLLKNPGFTAVAVLTLALGMGGSTAIFSLINGVILRPLPLFEPERLVSGLTQVGDSRSPQTSYSSYLDWREQCTTFEDLAIYDPSSCLLTGGEEPERVG